MPGRSKISRAVDVRECSAEFDKNESDFYAGSPNKPLRSPAETYEARAADTGILIALKMVVARAKRDKI